MKIHIRQGELFLLDLHTRMPFKYGIVTMTACPHVFAKLLVEVDGKPSVGLSADHLPPKWFTKVPDKSIDDEVLEMARVHQQALTFAVGLQADSPYSAWQEIYSRQARWGADQQLPALLTQFGSSLMERALLDAVCRAAGVPFAQALHENRLGLQLGDFHAQLAGRQAAEFLPKQPLQALFARHTVGLTDPLEPADIPAQERLNDGLPQAFSECLTRYGLRHFKIKVQGHLEQDRTRLRRLAKLLAEQGPIDRLCTLDGNEQFHSLTEFRVYWEKLTADPELRDFLAQLYFVEQPLHRDVALQPSVADELARWPGKPRLLIDESDADLTSLATALQLGYVGTSHKNCKGVFKSIAHACLLEKLRREQPKSTYIQSGEDLANIGPIALLQDLTVCASLGIRTVERNGHHYFSGLSQFPASIQQAVQQAHSDLYHTTPAGWPSLTIRAGLLEVGSLLRAPFGVAPLLDPTSFLSYAAWWKLHAPR